MAAACPAGFELDEWLSPGLYFLVQFIEALLKILLTRLAQTGVPIVLLL
jgi:hypothetical protein